MSTEQRRKLIETIEKRRGSKVISYITSDRHNVSAMISGDAVSIIHEHILELKEAERSKLDLFLYSRGGHADVPWTLVSMFRQYCHKGSFSVLVPYRAHSAATVICLEQTKFSWARKPSLGPSTRRCQAGLTIPRMVTHQTVYRFRSRT